MMNNDKKMQLIDKIKARYPKLENDPLMEDLEAIMYEESDMEGMDEEFEEEEEGMGEEEFDEESMMSEEEPSVGEEDDFMTEPDEDEDGDMASLMIAMGKPKKRRK